MRWILFVAVPVSAALLLVFGAAADSKPNSCSKDWVCVEPVDRGADGVDFQVRNLRPWPVAVTIEAKLRGPNGRFNYETTVDVPGKETVVALRHPASRATARDRYRYTFDWTVGSQSPEHYDDYKYRLPYARGKRYYVLQGYGSRFSHTGLERHTVDFDMPVGTPVHAAREGTVVRVQEAHNKGCWRDGCGRYANFIVVLHPDGTTGEYYHLRKDGALVEPGERVARGQHIGYSGNTGHTTMPHLHFGVYRASTWGRTESIPVRFSSANGVVDRPRHGPGYFAD